MAAPCCFRLATICSFRSLLARMAVFSKPAASRMRRASTLR
jgi:hypothetical protein